MVSSSASSECGIMGELPVVCFGSSISSYRLDILHWEQHFLMGILEDRRKLHRCSGPEHIRTVGKNADLGGQKFFLHFLNFSSFRSQERIIVVLVEEGAEVLEEHQCNNFPGYPKFPGYLHETLRADIRTIGTDTSLELQTKFCVELTAYSRIPFIRNSRRICEIFGNSPIGSMLKLPNNSENPIFRNSRRDSDSNSRKISPNQ